MFFGPEDVTGLDLAAFRGSLSRVDAERLGRARGGLSLPGVTSLGLEEACLVAHHAGPLSLAGLERLDAATARELAGSRGGLRLRGLRAIDADVAAALATHCGDLRLDGLEAISPALAAALATHRGRLTLSGLESISAVAAAALAGHQGDLVLDGLTSLPAAVAASLAGHPGWLSLASLRWLDHAAASALAAHGAWLGLPALEGSPTAVAALGGCRQIGLPRGAAPAPAPASPAEPEPSELVIIGAGLAGICMAIKLREQGRKDFVILEKAGSIGGTWRDNTYPGCGCDVPAHVYSYSFAQQAGWSGTFPGQAEILAYIRRVAARYGIEEKIRFNADVRTLAWDDQSRSWLVETAAGGRLRARVVVAATGGISVPRMPRLPGLDRFAGPVVHTARWRHDLDLTGRRVAVIGTGASAVQVIPELAGRVERLLVFQRSPPWVLPRPGGQARSSGPVRRSPTGRRRCGPSFATFSRTPPAAQHPCLASGASALTHRRLGLPDAAGRPTPLLVPDQATGGQCQPGHHNGRRLGGGNRRQQFEIRVIVRSEIANAGGFDRFRFGLGKAGDDDRLVHAGPGERAGGHEGRRSGQPIGQHATGVNAAAGPQVQHRQGGELDR